MKLMQQAHLTSEAFRQHDIYPYGLQIVSKPLPLKCKEHSSMADVTKVEEGSAFPEKHKLDLPNSINKTLDDKEEGVEEHKSDPNKRQKLENPAENEKNSVCAVTVVEKLVELKDGKEAHNTDENDDKNEHFKAEAATVDRGKAIAMVDKGKGILIDESEEEDEDEYGYGYSSDNSDCDFSDGFDCNSEDDPFY